MSPRTGTQRDEREPPATAQNAGHRANPLRSTKRNRVVPPLCLGDRVTAARRPDAGDQAPLFQEDPTATAASGKTIASLRNSRIERESILQMFDGDLPQSIMRRVCEHRETDVGHGTYRPHEDGLPGGAFKVSGQGSRAGALSVFPQNIGRAMVRLYSEPGDVVLDPFAGHDSRMGLCVKAGRHYIGFDVCKRFMDANFAAADRLRASYANVRIELHLQDSRTMPLADEVADFTLTSPPYWDIEEYGGEAEQLGRARTYDGFLSALTAVAAENYRCLRPGAFAAWFINDFRRNGTFHVYHADTLRVLQAVGFIAHDVVIVDLGPAIRSAFATQIVEQQILPKRHEYGLIMRKPSA